jgi:putative chitinase
MIDLSRIKDHIPSEVYKNLLDVCIKYQINTPLRLCHFLAQCAHESADFKHVSENLNYSLEALMRVFPKYFTIENVNGGYNGLENRHKLFDRFYVEYC